MKWWFLHVVHNCIAHPLLVVAEAAAGTRLSSVQRALYRFHDVTVPEGDVKNRLRLLDGEDR